MLLELRQRLRSAGAPQDIVTPVDWPGKADVPTLVSMITMVANTLGHGNLTPQNVRQLFPRDGAYPQDIPHILQLLEEAKQIDAINYRLEQILTDSIFPFMPDIRSRILNELKRGNLVVPVVSTNRWGQIVGNQPTDSANHDKLMAVLIHGFHTDGRNLTMDVIDPHTGSLTIPFEKLRDTLHVESVVTSPTTSMLFAGSIFSFHHFMVFSQRSQPLKK